MAVLKSISPDSSIGLIGEVETTTKAVLDELVVQSHSAFSTWSKQSILERVSTLEKLYDVLKNQQHELALLESQEMGMPIEESAIDLESGLNYFRWYLDNSQNYIAPEVSFENEKELHTVYYEPIGVAAVIMPWNFPFSNFIWGAIPNLIVGNTVVFKHSEEVIVTSKMYDSLAKDILPAGVLNFIYGAGDIGELLIHSDIDLICFTGSTKTGQHLYQVAAEKLIKVILELGGSAPGIVFADADLDTVVETVYLNRFGNCGQICDGLKRLIIHESIADSFIEKMKIKLESLIIGNPTDEKTNIGPLVAERQVVLLEGQINDSVKDGAVIIIGGKRPNKLQGAYYLPTIMTNVSKGMRVWSEETFGPVLPIMTFSTYDEAIELANDTPFGLGGYVFSQDAELAEKVARGIKTGMISINGAFYVIPADPFGGCKKSGLGREHGKWGLRELTDPKVVARYK